MGFWDIFTSAHPVQTAAKKNQVLTWLNSVVPTTEDPNDILSIAPTESSDKSLAEALSTSIVDRPQPAPGINMRKIDYSNVAVSAWQDPRLSVYKPQAPQVPYAQYQQFYHQPQSTQFQYRLQPTAVSRFQIPDDEPQAVLEAIEDEVSDDFVDEAPIASVVSVPDAVAAPPPPPPPPAPSEEPVAPNTEAGETPALSVSVPITEDAMTVEMAELPSAISAVASGATNIEPSVSEDVDAVVVAIPQPIDEAPDVAPPVDATVVEPPAPPPPSVAEPATIAPSDEVTKPPESEQASLSVPSNESSVHISEKKVEGSSLDVEESIMTEPESPPPKVVVEEMPSVDPSAAREIEPVPQEKPGFDLVDASAAPEVLATSNKDITSASDDVVENLSPPEEDEVAEAGIEISAAHIVDHSAASIVANIVDDVVDDAVDDEVVLPSPSKKNVAFDPDVQEPKGGKLGKKDKISFKAKEAKRLALEEQKRAEAEAKEQAKKEKEREKKDKKREKEKKREEETGEKRAVIKDSSGRLREVIQRKIINKVIEEEPPPPPPEEKSSKKKKLNKEERAEKKGKKKKSRRRDDSGDEEDNLVIEEIIEPAEEGPSKKSGTHQAENADVLDEQSEPALEPIPIDDTATEVIVETADNTEVIAPAKVQVEKQSDDLASADAVVVSIEHIDTPVEKFPVESSEHLKEIVSSDNPEVGISPAEPDDDLPEEVLLGDAHNLELGQHSDSLEANGIEEPICMPDDGAELERGIQERPATIESSNATEYDRDPELDDIKDSTKQQTEEDGTAVDTSSAEAALEMGNVSFDEDPAIPSDILLEDDKDATAEALTDDKTTDLETLAERSVSPVAVEMSNTCDEVEHREDAVLASSKLPMEEIEDGASLSMLSEPVATTSLPPAIIESIESKIKALKNSLVAGPLSSKVVLTAHEDQVPERDSPMTELENVDESLASEATPIHDDCGLDIEDIEIPLLEVAAEDGLLPENDSQDLVTAISEPSEAPANPDFEESEILMRGIEDNIEINVVSEDPYDPADNVDETIGLDGGPEEISVVPGDAHRFAEAEDEFQNKELDEHDLPEDWDAKPGDSTSSPVEPSLLNEEDAEAEIEEPAARDDISDNASNSPHDAVEEDHNQIKKVTIEAVCETPTGPQNIDTGTSPIAAIETIGTEESLGDDLSASSAHDAMAEANGGPENVSTTDVDEVDHDSGTLPDPTEETSSLPALDVAIAQDDESMDDDPTKLQAEVAGVDIETEPLKVDEVEFATSEDVQILAVEPAHNAAEPVIVDEVKTTKEDILDQIEPPSAPIDLASIVNGAEVDFQPTEPCIDADTLADSGKDISTSSNGVVDTAPEAPPEAPEPPQVDAEVTPVPEDVTHETVIEPESEDKRGARAEADSHFIPEPDNTEPLPVLISTEANPEDDVAAAEPASLAEARGDLPVDKTTAKPSSSDPRREQLRRHRSQRPDREERSPPRVKTPPKAARPSIGMVASFLGAFKKPTAVRSKDPKATASEERFKKRSTRVENPSIPPEEELSRPKVEKRRSSAREEVVRKPRTQDDATLEALEGKTVPRTAEKESRKDRPSGTRRRSTKQDMRARAENVVEEKSSSRFEPRNDRKESEAPPSSDAERRRRRRSERPPTAEGTASTAIKPIARRAEADVAGSDPVVKATYESTDRIANESPPTDKETQTKGKQPVVIGKPVKTGLFGSFFSKSNKSETKSRESKKLSPVDKPLVDTKLARSTPPIERMISKSKSAKPRDETEQRVKRSSRQPSAEANNPSDSKKHEKPEDNTDARPTSSRRADTGRQSSSRSSRPRDGDIGESLKAAEEDISKQVERPRTRRVRSDDATKRASATDARPRTRRTATDMPTVPEEEREKDRSERRRSERRDEDRRPERPERRPSERRRRADDDHGGKRPEGAIRHDSHRSAHRRSRQAPIAEEV